MATAPLARPMNQTAGGKARDCKWIAASMAVKNQHGRHTKPRQKGREKGAHSEKLWAGTPAEHGATGASAGAAAWGPAGSCGARNMWHKASTDRSTVPAPTREILQCQQRLASTRPGAQQDERHGRQRIPAAQQLQGSGGRWAAGWTRSEDTLAYDSGAAPSVRCRCRGTRGQHAAPHLVVAAEPLLHAGLLICLQYIHTVRSSSGSQWLRHSKDPQAAAARSCCCSCAGAAASRGTARAPAGPRKGGHGPRCLPAPQNQAAARAVKRNDDSHGAQALAAFENFRQTEAAVHPVQLDSAGLQHGGRKRGLMWRTRALGAPARTRKRPRWQHA